MAEYIDRDRLFWAFEKESWFNNADRDDVAEPLLLSAPAEDVVPVVRCKDCYHKTEDGNGKPYCLELEMYLNKELDFFCSYGERKESNDGKTDN